MNKTYYNLQSDKGNNIKHNSNSQECLVEQLHDEEVLEKCIAQYEMLHPHRDKFISLAVQQLYNTIRYWVLQNYISHPHPMYGPKIIDHDAIKVSTLAEDIQILCIVPQLFTRQHHFFTLLLTKLRNKHNITQIYPMPHCITPCIKLIIHGVQTTITMAIIPFRILSSHSDLISDIHLQTLNRKEMLCMTSYRIFVYLQKTIIKYADFRLTLKIIKLWAHCRGLYSLNMGYVQSNSLSIMLAKISQMHPNHSAPQLLNQFFAFYSEWDWKLPIQLIDRQSYDIDHQSCAKIMVYLPFQPYVNLLFHISSGFAQQIKKEIKIAHTKLVSKNIKELLCLNNFFTEHSKFIVLSILSQKREDFQQLVGCIQSKLYNFVDIFESYNKNLNIGLFIYPQRFKAQHLRYEYCIKYYIAIKHQKQENKRKTFDFTNIIKDFCGLIEDCIQIEKIPKIINYEFDEIMREDMEETIIDQAKQVFS